MSQPRNGDQGHGKQPFVNQSDVQIDQLPVNNSDLRSDNSITVIAPQLTNSPRDNIQQRTGSDDEDEEIKRERPIFMSETK